MAAGGGETEPRDARGEKSGNRAPLDPVIAWLIVGCTRVRLRD